MLMKRDKEEEKKDEKFINIVNKRKKAETALKEHEKHTNLILALSALGCAMANADGEISPEEIIDLHEFIGGLSSQKYPTHIIEQINEMISNPPTFSDAMKHGEIVDAIKFPEIRNLLVMIMESDSVTHKKEEAFLKVGYKNCTNFKIETRKF